MKIFKHKIIFGIILAFAVASISCCFPQRSFAHSISSSKVSEKIAVCCHKDASQNQDTSSTKTCHCNKISPFLKNQNVELKPFTFASWLSNYHSVDRLLTQLVKEQSQSPVFYSSPSRFKSPVPLYLQNSVLRI